MAAVCIEDSNLSANTGQLVSKWKQRQLALKAKVAPFQGRTTFIFEGKQSLVFAALFKISLPLRCQRQVFTEVSHPNY